MHLTSVAVVIPTRGRVEALKRCLSQLLPYVSTHPECTIVVSDDGNALETSRALGEGFDSVKVVQGPQKGPSANRNCGATHSTGELLVFLDDDCIPEQNLIAEYQSAAATLPQYGVFEGRITAQGQVKGFGDAAPENETGGKLWSCNFGVRREVFNAIGGFDERYPFPAMEDVDFRLRVQSQSPIIFLRQARVYHAVETRLGWKIIQHHALSHLLYMQIHGTQATGQTLSSFFMTCLRLMRRGWRRVRTGTGKNPEQLFYMIVENAQLFLMVMFWGFHRRLIKWFYRPCCAKCETLIENLSSK